MEGDSGVWLPKTGEWTTHFGQISVHRKIELSAFSDTDLVTFPLKIWGPRKTRSPANEESGSKVL